MSRCYPFPPPGYEKAPQPDVALPHKDKKDRHKDKHKDKKKKKKKDGDTNGEAHDKDSSSRPSKQPRTVSVNDLLQSKDEKQNGKVAPPSAAQQQQPPPPPPPVATPSTSSAAEHPPPVVVKKPLVIPPPQPLYSKQEPNGRAVLVSPAESSGNEIPSSSIIPPNNLDSQRQSSELVVASPPCEMLALKPTSTWSDVPDEDWLFAGLPHRKPKAEVDKEGVSQQQQQQQQQVWAEAVFLPSCELYALPYVVPF